MDKKLRKQLEQQLSTTIAYFLKKTDEKATAKMEKQIKAASKDLAKKFIKNRKETTANKPVVVAKPVAKKDVVVKTTAKKTVKKAAKRSVKKTSTVKASAAKKSAPKKAAPQG